MGRAYFRRKRSSSGRPRLGEGLRELSGAARALRRSPGFASAVVVTLALGIGATTAIFSAVYGVLLRPLPYEAAERQVRVQVLAETRTGGRESRPLSLSVRDTQALAGASRLFEHVGNIGFHLSNWPGHEPRWSGAAVSASVFPMLGVQPVAGRLFGPDDEAEGAPERIILSHNAWQKHFAGEHAALGQSILLEPALGAPARGKHYTIIGVLPEGFDCLPGSDAQYWVPLRRSDRGSVVARLAPGVPTAAAAEAVDAFVRAIQTPTAAPRTLGYEIVELHEQLVAPVKTALLTLFGAVGVVLLIACVNVTNLILARSLSRRREMAIRKAIGASDGHIMRLALYESLLLTGAAAAIAIVLAAGGVELLKWLAVTSGRIDLGQGSRHLLPRLAAVGVDWAVLAFTSGIAALVSLLISIAPALHMRGTNPIAAVRGGSRSDDAGSRIGSSAARRAFVVLQVALSMVLLIGGGLLVRSFIALTRVDAGYDASRLLTFQVSLPSDTYPLSRLTSFAEELVSNLRSAPGITAAAYAKQLPLVQLRDTLRISGTPPVSASPADPSGDTRVVSWDYFQTLDVRVIAGREFELGDAAGQPNVLVINEALARRDFGGAARAVGQQVYVGSAPQPWTIVGVVADMRQTALSVPAAPQLFIDARQWAPGLSPLFPLTPYYTVRIDGDERSALASIKSAVERVERDAMLFNVARMEDIVSFSIATPRMYAVVLGALAAVGLAMALVGIYSVISYVVSQQTREIGIRMALGARPARVLRRVLRQAIVLTVIGIAIGVPAAVAFARSLESMLFGLEALDAPTFVGAALVFVGAAALAAFRPAWTASRVDPCIAIRTE
jgi:putative ABC transport system permease protein